MFLTQSRRFNEVIKHLVDPILMGPEQFRISEIPDTYTKRTPAELLRSTFVTLLLRYRCYKY